MKIKMEVQGGQALVAKLQQTEKHIGETYMVQALAEAAEIPRQDIQERINLGPGRGGHLRDTIKVREIKKVSGGFNADIGATGPKAFILQFIERGTRRMAAQAPMRKAIDATQHAVEQKFREVLSRLLGGG
ncbi:MAG: HK97 gp10 family phage protein [Sphaerochaeta sp.]|jgi:HK97 gp10 family phage protein|nr:HK97 gp10 family phage protein [Sphaerochaeta sp.]